MEQIAKTLELLKGMEITEVILDEEGKIVFNIGMAKDYCLFVYSTWRIEHNNKIVAIWNTSSLDVDKYNLFLETIFFKNEKITHFELSNFYDLKISLTNGKSMSIFCDLSSTMEDTSWNRNWVICDKIQNICYVITNDFLIKQTPFRKKKN